MELNYNKMIKLIICRLVIRLILIIIRVIIPVIKLLIGITITYKIIDMGELVDYSYS